MKTNIQERYRKPIEEFVQRALKEYKNKISKFGLEFVKKEFVEDAYSSCALRHTILVFGAFCGFHPLVVSAWGSDVSKHTKSFLNTNKNELVYENRDD